MKQCCPLPPLPTHVLGEKAGEKMILQHAGNRRREGHSMVTTVAVVIPVVIILVANIFGIPALCQEQC